MSVVIKQIFYIALLFLCASSVTAQIWTNGTDFTANSRDDGVSFSIDNIGYFGTGRDNGYKDYNDWWKYEDETWTAVSPLPGIERQYCSSFVLNGKGYLIGGRSKFGKPLNELWQYNPETDEWAQKADFPSSGRYSAVGFAINGFGFFGTGTNSDSCFADFWRYNPRTDVWSEVSSFPRKQFESVEFVIGGNGYVGLGIDLQNNYYNEFWKYHFPTNKWVQVSSLPTEGRKHAKAEANGTTAIIVGGQTETAFVSECWQYTSVEDSWEEISPLPTTPIRGMASFNTNNDVYFINGLDSNQTRSNKVWKYKLEHTETENPIIIYPNPTTEVVNIDFSRLNATAVKITVLDIAGRVILTQSLQTNFTQMDISVLRHGVYLFLLETEGKMYLKKVVVNH